MRSVTNYVIVICAIALLSCALPTPATASTEDTIALPAMVQAGTPTSGNSELNDNLALLRTLLESTLNANSSDNLSDTLVVYRQRFQGIFVTINQQFDTMAAVLLRTPALVGKLAEINNVRDEINGKFQTMDQKLAELIVLCADQNTTPAVLMGKIKELIEYIATNAIFERSALIGSGELPHRTFSPERLWGGQAGSIGFWSPNIPASTSGDQPGAGDMAFTEEVTLTAGIIELASALDSNPIKIYQYVKNNIEYEPYYGSIKSADEVLRQNSGNDIDIAHLLIALLRASHIPARYTYGTVEIPIERAKNWIGITDEATLIRFLACNGIPTTAVYGGNGLKAVRIEHMWVDAYVNYGPFGGAVPGIGAKRWVPLDASFRPYTETPSIDISGVVPFDWMAYIESDTDLPPVFYYVDKVKEYLRANYSDSTELGEAFWNRNQKPEHLEILPITTPYHVIEYRGRYSELPDILRHKVRFGINISRNVASKEFNVYELQGKRLTLSYAPATTADKAVMDEYHGYYNPPAFLVELKPQIQIEGEPIITGSEIGLGESHQFDIDFIFPGGMVMDRVSNRMVAGEYYGVAVVAGEPPSSSVTARTINFNKSHNLPLRSNVENPGIYAGTMYNPYYYETDLLESDEHPSENTTGELLFQTAVEYFNELFIAEKIAGNLLHNRHTVQPMVSITALVTDVDYCFSIPSATYISGVFIDVDRHIYVVGNETGNISNERQFMMLAGFNNSFWEHNLFQARFDAGGISTVKIFQIARQQRIPLITVTSENIEPVLIQLAISDMLKDEIRNYVRTGRNVIVPQYVPEIAGYAGTGFLAVDPQAGAGAYMISNQLAGGQTIFPANKYYVTGASLVSYLINAGSEAEQLVAFDRLSRAKNMLLNIGYKAEIMVTKSNGEFIDAVTYSKMGLFYYQGHTWYGKPILYYSEGGSNQIDVVAVQAACLADGIGPRIVIMMTCNSFGCGVVGPDDFLIDGYRVHSPLEIPMYEMYLGWDGRTSTKFGIEYFTPIIFEEATKNLNASIPGSQPAYATLESVFTNLQFLLAARDMSAEILWRIWFDGYLAAYILEKRPEPPGLPRYTYSAGTGWDSP